MHVGFLSSTLGFCGLIYEFVFAQTLSVLFGHSVTQYALTIGLFIAGMGAGAHWAESFKTARLSLWRAQLVLSLLAPAAAVLIWWLAVSGFTDSARVFAYAAILAVGGLTGTELPLLLRIKNSPGIVLSADYFGMLLACVLFPLVLLPAFGVFTTLFATAILNSLIMVFLRLEKSRFTAVVPGLLVLFLFLEPGLREWLSQKLIAG